jgi:hypothetical protein
MPLKEIILFTLKIVRNPQYNMQPASLSLCLHSIKFRPLCTPYLVNIFSCIGVFMYLSRTNCFCVCYVSMRYISGCRDTFLFPTTVVIYSTGPALKFFTSTSGMCSFSVCLISFIVCTNTLTEFPLSSSSQCKSQSYRRTLYFVLEWSCVQLYKRPAGFIHQNDLKRKCLNTHIIVYRPEQGLLFLSLNHSRSK